MDFSMFSLLSVCVFLGLSLGKITLFGRGMGGKSVVEFRSTDLADGVVSWGPANASGVPVGKLSNSPFPVCSSVSLTLLLLLPPGVIVDQEKSGLVPGLGLRHCALGAGVGLGEEALVGVKSPLVRFSGVARPMGLVP